MLADTKRGARVKKKLLPGGPWRARPQSAPLGQLLAMAPHLSDQVYRPGAPCLQCCGAPLAAPALEPAQCCFATGLGCLTLDGRGSHACVASWSLLTCVPRGYDTPHWWLALRARTTKALLDNTASGSLSLPLFPRRARALSVPVSPHPVQCFRLSHPLISFLPEAPRPTAANVD